MPTGVADECASESVVSGKAFHGWRIVGSAVGIEFLVGALFLQSYAVYAALWREEFGWSATMLAVAFSLHRAETGLLGPLQGILLDRFGARTVMRLGAVGFGIGFVLLSRMNSVQEFAVAFIIMALGGSMIGVLSLMTVIINWFDRHRAMALAWFKAGKSLGGLTVPLLVLALEVFGWRTVAFASGLLVTCVGLLLIQVMHNRPEDVGQVPDGAQRKGSGLKAGDSVELRAESTMGEAVRSRAFWAISFGHACAVAVVSTMLVHLAVHLREDSGVPLSQVGVLLAIITGAALVGHPLGGWLGDRLPIRFVAAGAMVGHAIGMALLAFGSSMLVVTAFAVVHGLAWGIRSPLMGAIRAAYFGRRNFATIMGTSSLIVMIGSLMAPILSGFVADTTGSFRPSFAVLAMTSLIGAALFAGTGKVRNGPEREAAAEP